MANATVRSVVLQADGKALVGGDFTAIDARARHRVARLMPDGSVDTSFGEGLDLADGAVHGIAVRPDGMVVLAGTFTHINGSAYARVARLRADGAVDAGFHAGAGANGTVRSVVLQADGKILIGGDFTSVHGVARHRVARLHADGSLDTGFDPGDGANATVHSLALQRDGSIIAAGAFTQMAGAQREHIARLLPSGALMARSAASCCKAMGKC